MRHTRARVAGAAPEGESAAPPPALARVLALQRDAGNAAVTHWLQRDPYTPREPPLQSQPPPGLTAEIVGE